MTVSQTITIHGRRFVAGLFWQTLSRPRAFMQEARDIGRRDKMDVVAIRKGRVLQAGFARRAVGNQALYSLASTLAGILGDDWIGVFLVDAETDSYAIVGTKNGAIIPGCDAIGSRQEIEDRLRADFNLHRFNRVFCPEEFEFGGEERQLAEIIGSGKVLSEYKLTSLATGVMWRKLLATAAVLMVLAGLGVGFLLYRQHQADLREEAELAAAAEAAQKAAELAAASGQAAAPAALAHPWATQPSAIALRRSCVEGLYTVPLSLGGWLVETGTCNGASLLLTYRRNGTATIASLNAAAAARGYRVDMVDDAGDGASLSLLLAVLPPAGDDQLTTMASLSDGIKSVFQSRRIPFSIAIKPPPPPPPVLPGEEAPPAPPAPDWQTSTFTITGRHTPAVVMAGIEDLPGVRLLSIAAKRTDIAIDWTLTGEIHGK